VLLPHLPSPHTLCDFVNGERGLQPEGRHPSRGVAGSGFRPLSNIPTAASRRSLGRVSVPVWPVTLSGRLPVKALVGHYPTNKLIGREHIPHHKSFPPTTMKQSVASGISHPFRQLSQSEGQITHVLLTRSPLEYPPKEAFPLDLHVLSTPPAFVLSQDQTLH